MVNLTATRFIEEAKDKPIDPDIRKTGYRIVIPNNVPAQKTKSKNQTKRRKRVQKYQEVGK